MPVEIERKFLVTNDSWQHSVSKTLSLKQGYLNTDPDRTVRVRISNNEAFLTIKSRQVGLSRTEFEYPIPVEDAEALLKLCDKTLSKDRHHVVIGKHTWEIDVFHGRNEGLLLAEIELNEESEAFELPDWAGEEVSQDKRYFNSQLISNPFCEWATE